jgi:hypothetical protein
MIGGGIYFMNRNYVGIGGGILILLLVLYYISPFYQEKPPFVCYNYEGVAYNPAYGEQIPVCGDLVSGNENVSLGIWKDEAATFCLDNTKKVEESCGIRMDGVLREEETTYLNCEYIQLNNASVQAVVSITRIPGRYSETGRDEIRSSWWRAYNQSFNETCNALALSSA